MICGRCRKTSAVGDGLKCKCESKMSCTGGAGGGDLVEPNDLGDPGDPSDSGAGYQWTCAVCRHPAGNVDPPSRVVTAVNSISEKVELVNKLQLPRLSSDLSYIRSTTEKIARQNESILRSIDALRSGEGKAGCSREYRKRKLTLAPRPKLQETGGDTSADRMTRHRPRRAIALQELLLLLNRKLHQSSAGSKQQ